MIPLEVSGASQTISFTVEKLESFPTAIVAAVSIAVVVLVVAGLLVWFRKRKAGKSG